MAAATRIPASTIAAQTHPDSPDDDAAGATAATVVLVAVGADSAELSVDTADVDTADVEAAAVEAADVEAADESAEPTAIDTLSKIIQGLKGQEVAPVREPWRTVNPYRRLEAGGEEDAEFFFGRDVKTTEILQTLIARTGRLCALIGNSGVGKSSVVQAGVIGSLKRQRWPGDVAPAGRASSPTAVPGLTSR